MRKLALLYTVALVIFLLVPVVAQEELPDFIEHSECEVDLSGQSLTLMHVGDLSGVFAPITQPLLAGLDDAVADFNERGGVCGATIELPDPTTIDTGGDQEQTSAIYERIKEDTDFLILYSSDDSELLRDSLAEDEIANVISAGSIEGLYGGEDDGYDAPGWSFATNPLYVDQIGSFCDWASENMSNAVIGYLSWPTAFGQAAFTPESIAYCESVGVGVVAEPEFFAPGSEIQGQIQNLLDAGATVIYTNTLATGPAEIAATLVNMGERENVILAGVNWTLDTSVGFLGQTTLAADGLPSVNGLVGSMPFAWWTEVDNPGIALITEVADAAERDPLTRNIAYLLGWQSVDLFIESHIQTANREGAEGITGAALKETLEGLDYSPMGLVSINFEDGAIRDVSQNRIAMLAYLGEDGTPAALPDNPPVVAEGPSGPILIPIVVPLTDYTDTPDLRPGMMDMESDG